MDKQQVSTEFKKATEELLKTIRAVPDELFNERPSADSWSPGQVVEHLIKVEAATLRLFSGSTQKAERDPEEKVGAIRNRFLNFENRMNAYGPIMPDKTKKNKTKALGKIQDIRQRTSGLVNIQDLTELVVGFEHPLFGFMSRVEWIVFNITHGKRHAHQIRTIQDLLT